MRIPVFGLSTVGCMFLTLLACEPKGKNSNQVQSPPPQQLEQAVNTEGSAPKLEIEERTFAAGTVKQGEDVKHTFLVRNRGLGTLNIEKVQGT